MDLELRDLIEIRSEEVYNESEVENYDSWKD